MNFEQLFKSISPEEIDDNPFIMAGKVFPVITARTAAHYNSMLGSGGGWGVLFRKPTAWCILRADRYTLEIIRKEKTYTMCYFSDEYREQILFLGSKSGRDSEKMREVELTSVRTPSGNIVFQEARLILECKLTQLTTVLPEDFCEQEARDYIQEAYEEASVYRQYVFGEIAHVWIKK